MSGASDRFGEAAFGIGARLCRDAIWAGNRCNWLGPSMEVVGGQWQVVHRAFGPDLYSGTSGIALFLAHLFARTGEPQFRRAAEGAARQALSRIGDLSPQTSAGVYSGLLGIAWAMSELSECLDEPRWLEEAESLLAQLVSDGPNPHGVDVIMGSAGAIPALIALEDKLEHHGLLDLADLHGKALLQSAAKNPSGWSWDTLNGASPRHLTGFAHGAAGVAWACLELFEASGETIYRDAAVHAIRYEQSHFSSGHDNWPDFRDHSDSGYPQVGPVYATAWCHGSPGIGLSRLRACEILGDEDYRPQAEAALRSTRAALGQSARNGADFTFCHGVAGNAELLLYASEVFGEPETRSEVELLAAGAIDRFKDAGVPWPCGVLGAGETPGLMLGLAGIGYFFLRLAPVKPMHSVVMIGPRV